VRRFTALVFVATTTAALSATGASAGVTACASAGSRTVYKNAEGRFFAKQGHYYSCSYRYGKKFRLAESGFRGEDRYGPFRIHSRYAAYTYRPSCGACESQGAYVLVQDLITGRHRYFVGALGGRPVEPADGISQRVTDLELKRNGSVAWIAQQTDASTQPARTRIQVRARDTKGGRRLDEGAAIRLRSLALDGSALSWQRRNEPSARTARLA
jgi:hypothetical protein